MVDKSKVRKIIDDLPIKIGSASLAIIIGVGEGIFESFSGILEGPGKLTIGKAYRKSLQRGTFLENYSDMYEELKNLKENSLRTKLWRLQKKCLVEKRKNSIYLTNLGLEYFKKIKEVDVKNKWDGKWRIVMFDIPEKIKKERVWMRRELYKLEYKPFQKSVFIGKFPIRENLFREINRKNLGNFVNLITVGEIDNEKILEEF